MTDVLIDSALDGRHASYFAFVPASSGAGTIYRVDDAGDSAGPYQGFPLPGGGGSTATASVRSAAAR